MHDIQRLFTQIPLVGIYRPINHLDWESINNTSLLKFPHSSSLASLAVEGQALQEFFERFPNFKHDTPVSPGYRCPFHIFEFLHTTKEIGDDHSSSILLAFVKIRAVVRAEETLNGISYQLWSHKPCYRRPLRYNGNYLISQEIGLQDLIQM